jgi:predicted transcriptional regulator
MRRKKKLSVSVGTIKESLDRFESVWKRAERGARVTPEYRLTFSSLPQLLKELSPARWALLEALHAEGKMTIYALAKHLGRDYKNVHTDVSRLLELGLIEKAKDDRVFVPWNVVAAELRLAA